VHISTHRFVFRSLAVQRSSDIVAGQLGVHGLKTRSTRLDDSGAAE
jgi:hypothetical protein